MHRITILVLFVGFLFAGASSVLAQAGVEVTDVQVKYTFGDQITFKARFQSSTPIQQASLFFQPQDDVQAHSEPLVIAADGTAQCTYSIQEGILRPFVRIDYWFETTLASGEKSESQRYSFSYNDNRFTWQTVQDASLRIHWYDGDAAFGQAALEAGEAGLQAIQALFPVTNNASTDVYIYSSAVDVQNALSLGGMTWISGHASPDLGVVLVSIAPGDDQESEMQSQIPHELAHVLLYRLTGPAYNTLPTWLREGLASLAEQTQNPDDAQVLSSASKNKALLPILDLCGLFPQDASGAGLAYAESASFTRYLHDTYGASSLQALIQAYSAGLDCEEGATRTLGLSISQLDAHWQQAVLGTNAGNLAVQELLPFLVILLVILIIPIGYAVRIIILRRKSHGSDRSQ